MAVSCVCRRSGRLDRTWGSSPVSEKVFDNYRPQRSCSQGNIFAPVCHSVHRGVVCLSACWDTTPREQTPPRVDTPQNRHPPRAETPPSRKQNPPPPIWEADSGIRSMSGRCAFLFDFVSGYIMASFYLGKWVGIGGGTSSGKIFPFYWTIMSRS